MCPIESRPCQNSHVLTLYPPLPKRLDKYLRDCTRRSLVALRQACAAGRVRVGVADPQGRGQSDLRVTLAQDELVFEGDSVELDGQRVEPRTLQEHLAFHKPCCVTSTTADPDGLEDLSAWLRRMPEGVFPIGRLDRMTSGLLLFTSDGDFANALLHPAHHVEKHYRVVVRDRIRTGDPRLSMLVRGVVVAGSGTPLCACYAEVTGYDGDTTELTLCLREGKHRQIRKMCQALRLPVIGLHRKAIGRIEIGALEPGAFRGLGDAEVESLWADAGGRALVVQRQRHALGLRARALRDRGSPDQRLERWLALAALPSPT